MPRYSVTRHEDWIAYLEIDADSPEDAEAKAEEADWSETDSTFNSAGSDYEAEEIDERGLPV